MTGQQRLTTITLIYIVIYQILQKLIENESNEKLQKPFKKEQEKIKSLLFSDSNALDEKAPPKLKLKVTENNKDTLNTLLDFSEQQKLLDINNQLIINYKFFKGKINEKNYEKVCDGIEQLLIIDVSLDTNKDSPQKIFETLNSTGLPLTQADLIRNYVLMSQKSYDQQKELYNDYWIGIEKNCKDDAKNEDNTSLFIRDFLTMKHKTVSNKNKVYETFKKKYPIDEKTPIVLEEVLAEMKRFSAYYNKLINPKNEENRNLQEAVENIKRLERTVYYPFLMQIYDDYTEKKLSETEFIDLLQTLQSYLLRRFICDTPPGGLSQMFMSLYKKIENKKENNNKSPLECLQEILLIPSGKEYFPKDEAIKKALETKNIYKSKINKDYILDNLENYGRKEKSNVKSDAITIEHIFPQRSDKWKEDLSQDDFKYLEEHQHTLANLTYTGHNSELSNQIFREKKIIYSESRLYLNEYLKTIDEWNKENMNKRLESLYARFIEIWPCPTHIQIEKEDPTKEKEENIQNVDDFTGINLISYTFLDESTPCKTIKYMYRDIVKKFYSIDPLKFQGEESPIPLIRSKDKHRTTNYDPIDDEKNLFFHSNQFIS